MWREPLTGNTGENLSLTNLSTKRQRIAEPARTETRGDLLPSGNSRPVSHGWCPLHHRERSSSMKNRTREICTSGTVRDEDGNILIYSANDRGDRGKEQPTRPQSSGVQVPVPPIACRRAVSISDARGGNEPSSART